MDVLGRCRTARDEIDTVSLWRRSSLIESTVRTLGRVW